MDEEHWKKNTAEPNILSTQQLIRLFLSASVSFYTSQLTDFFEYIYKSLSILMAVSIRPAANDPVAVVCRLYNPLGFSHGYNLVFWCVFAGGWFGFILSRLPFLDFYGVYCNPDAAPGKGALPGECWYYLRQSRYKTGVTLHLATTLPAGLLSCLQFTPVIRHKAMTVHRISGWISAVLSVVGTASALMIARHSFGGGFASQTVLGLVGILFLGSLLLAIINIKRLRVDQHRAWMLRAWFYGGSILTMRIIMVLAAVIISKKGGYYAAMPCGKIHFLIKEQNVTTQRYPECTAYFDGTNPDQHAVVPAHISGQDEAQAAAALTLVAGGAFWLALFLHAFGIEIYLSLTPTKHERLRKASCQRQVAAAGHKRSGSSGLTADLLDDPEKLAPEKQTVVGVSIGPGSKDH